MGDHGGETLGCGDGGEAGCFVEGAFLDRKAPQDFTGREDSGADAADHLFRAPFDRQNVVMALSAGEFTKTDGHHFEEPAFEGAGEIGVPFDAGQEEDAVGIEGGFVHERFNALGRSAEGDDVEGTDDRDAHGGFVDAIVSEHVGLAFGSGGAVATHDWDDKGLGAVFFPEIDNSLCDAGDVGDAPAADANSNACAFGDAFDDVGGRKFVADVVFDVGNGAIREGLFSVYEPGKVHESRILRAGKR